MKYFCPLENVGKIEGRERNNATTVKTTTINGWEISSDGIYAGKHEIINDIFTFTPSALSIESKNWSIDKNGNFTGKGDGNFKNIIVSDTIDGKIFREQQYKDLNNKEVLQLRYIDSQQFAFRITPKDRSLTFFDSEQNYIFPYIPGESDVRVAVYKGGNLFPVYYVKKGKQMTVEFTDGKPDKTYNLSQDWCSISNTFTFTYTSTSGEEDTNTTIIKRIKIDNFDLKLFFDLGFMIDNRHVKTITISKMNYQMKNIPFIGGN